MKEGVEGIDFSSLLLLYLTLNETRHVHDNHPSYLVATTELSSHTTLMHAATEQGNRLITTEQLLQQAIFCSVINDFAFFLSSLSL